MRLEDQQARIAARLEKELAEYHALVAKVAKDGAARADSSPLRPRILEFLQGQPSVTSLRKIQNAMGESGDKVVWTLANLKRAGFVLNPKRGFWQINPHGKEGPVAHREPDVGF